MREGVSGYERHAAVPGGLGVSKERPTNIMLMQAIQATSKQRKTKAPVETPLALTEEFAGDPTKVVQWKAFVKRIDQAPMELSQVISQLNLFLAPPLLAVARRASFHQHWTGGGPWQ